MRTDGPSLTAQGVAAARSMLLRPSAPTGDPDADDRLTAAVAADVLSLPARARRGDGEDFLAYLRVRTAFFDQAVLRGIGDGVQQIVILGAGYDGRALRFRTPGVCFFEVDHPSTQADKRDRLVEVDADHDDIAFVGADLTEPGLADRLAAAGHDPHRPTLFLVEGLLRYLPERWFRELLAVLAEAASPGSVLAASISTRNPTEGPEQAEQREENERRLAKAGEPVLTVPDRDVALRWLAEAGWSVDADQDVTADAPDARPGRILVRARAAGR